MVLFSFLSKTNLTNLCKQCQKCWNNNYYFDYLITFESLTYLIVLILFVIPGVPNKTLRIPINIFYDHIFFDWSFSLFYNVFKLYFLRMEKFLLYDNFENPEIWTWLWVIFCTCKEINFLVILIFGDKTICTLNSLVLDVS